MDESGMFSGYASVFGELDNHNDVILPGAFEHTLLERHFGRNVKLLWQHEQKEPIGFFVKILEDEHGLYVEGKILLEVQKGREAYELLKSGAVGGLSIGYNVVDYSIDTETGIRLIKQVDLFEISLVTFPANEAAGVLEVKDA